MAGLAPERPHSLGFLATTGYAVVCMLLAVLVASEGAAMAPAGIAVPQYALQWRASAAEAMLDINEREADPRQRARRARIILRHRPLEGRAFRQVAESEEVRGGKDAGLVFRLHETAVRRTPRDRKSQAWMADAAFMRENHSEAAARVDLLLRMDAEIRPAIYARIIDLSHHPGFLDALIEVLAREPQWRESFLSWWSQQADDPSRPAMDQVHQGLARARSALSPAEREIRVQALWGESRWNEAYLVWAGGIPRVKHSSLGQIVNGDFEDVLGGKFDWSIAHGRGRHAQIVESHGNRSLRVEFTGDRVEGGEIGQVLLLPTGRHEISMRVRLEGLRAEQGLEWKVDCVAGDGQVALGSSAPLRGERPWEAIRFLVVVPPDCPAQWLHLQLSAGRVDRRLAGVAWFDDVTSRPLSMIEADRG